MDFNETITALASGNGGAIALIRVSGEKAADICDTVFLSPKGRTISEAKGFSMLYGHIVYDGEEIDDVIASVYKAPHSYTGENMVEISCHASKYIISRIMQALCDNGARPANAGEFTLRAFLNGKLDLSQAEAVADTIASHDKASHYIAVQQMRGGYSNELKQLRNKLLHIASLMELELDFSEEDVEFANRNEFSVILNEIEQKINTLTNSFSMGNAIKEGIKVAIIGSPNVGKSTLLNALLKEDRAIVSDIAGTTRDVIEDTIKIGGIDFRITDTAGLRESNEQIELMGIERTHKAAEQARIILLMFDIRTVTKEEISQRIENLKLSSSQSICILLNKTDIEHEIQVNEIVSQFKNIPVFAISAKKGDGIKNVLSFLEKSGNTNEIYVQSATVSNFRHYSALMNAKSVLKEIRNGIQNNISTELIVEDLRNMLNYIGEITGEVTNDEILKEIFSKFCVGK